ncbi:MAG: tetratricopeptide repeat protein [Planctomycetaceae bacterium]|nr:tetratricopeptide repeat protein [Planctomycetaceae bacterium]
MAAIEDFDVKQTVLLDGSFGPKEMNRLVSVLSEDASQMDALRDAAGELGAEESKGTLSHAGRVRLGAAYYLLGQYEEAVKCLKKGDGGALPLYYTAKSLFAMGHYDEAAKNFDAAQKSGYSADECTLGRAEVYRCQNKFEECLKQLDDLHGAVEQTAEYLYQRGAVLSQTLYGEEREQVWAYYERAERADKNHPGALFGLALENERAGNDEEALKLYERAVTRFPAYTGALVNLGLLYEDRGQYDNAVKCYQRVVDAQPENLRVRLFLLDAKASSEMRLDEETQRRKDRMNQILNLPVSDFELSVRSRNCLKTMGIMTLADLCTRTEQDLLASKNFGETSLVEIREMLTLKGLSMGMFAPEKPVPDVVDIATLPPEMQATLERPATDLNLSVRARKCLNRLNIQTIGELVRHTADEMLECKNFGVTSLNEIREKLVPFGIKLRGE